MGRLSKIILEGPKSHPRCLHEGEEEGVLASAEEEEGTGSQRSAGCSHKPREGNSHQADAGRGRPAGKSSHRLIF